MVTKVSRRGFMRVTGASLVVVAGAGLAELSNTRPAHAAHRPPQGVRLQYGMVFDTKKCIKCNACTIACIEENHLPPGVVYAPVLETEVGEYPNVRREFTPLICMHCVNPSCVPVCPVNATWKREEDGIVVIDYDKCIGCRYCITACPYGARYFDYGEYYNLEPRWDGYDGAPSPEYNQGLVRTGSSSPVGNTRKCTFCMHRVSKGLKPACVEACLGGVRYFGNLADPNDPLWELISRHGHMRLKEELGTEPSVYYLL